MMIFCIIIPLPLVFWIFFFWTCMAMNLSGCALPLMFLFLLPSWMKLSSLPPKKKKKKKLLCSDSKNTASSFEKHVKETWLHFLFLEIWRFSKPLARMDFCYSVYPNMHHTITWATCSFFSFFFFRLNLFSLFKFYCFFLNCVSSLSWLQTLSKSLMLMLLKSRTSGSKSYSCQGGYQEILLERGQVII